MSGLLSINNLPSVIGSVSLSSLTSASEIQINGLSSASLGQINFSSLQQISGTLSLIGLGSGSVPEPVFDSLAYVGADLVLTNNAFPEINIAFLTSIGGSLTVDSTVSLEALTSISGFLMINSMASPATVTIDALLNVGLDVTVLDAVELSLLLGGEGFAIAGSCASRLASQRCHHCFHSCCSRPNCKVACPYAYLRVFGGS